MKYSKVLGTLATLVGCLGALLALHTFHSQVKQPSSSSLFQQQQQQQAAVVSARQERHLAESQDGNDSNNPLTDDVTRDETCRNYLMEFLNGTTDAKDECQGMMNAFTEGDCQDTTGINNLRFLDGKSDTNNNETGLIDDVFEAWECCDHISSYYSKHCEDEQLDGLRLFGIVAVLIACWLAKSWLRVRGWNWIPDAGACILVGAVVGLVLRMLWSATAVQQTMIFNNNLFLQILLPPIIFEASLSIDKRAFRRDLFPIITFAILGTGFSAVAIGYITYYVSAWTSSSGTEALPFLESLVFGALMSSIDPVATLSILSSVGVGQGDTLYTLVFGESLLNDGVAIVLFDSLVRHIGDPDVVGRAHVGEVLWHFFRVCFGSVLIGWMCGALCTFYFWAMKGYNTAVSEGALFFTWALIPYYIADALELSGIISIMVMGFMLDYYIIGGFQDNRAEWNTVTHMDEVHTNNPFNPPETFREKCQKWCTQAFSGKGHMLEHSRSHVGYVAEVISSIVETAIFAYLGLFLFNDNNGDIKLTTAGIFACVSSRAVMVLVLCALINICVCLDVETRLTNIWRTLRGRGDLTMDVRQVYETTSANSGFLGARTQFILFTAGIRGAVSYALVQMIPVYDSVSRHGSLFKGELRAMTSATIVGVLFVFGALTYVGVDKNGGGSARSSSSPMEAEQTLSQLLMADNDPNDDRGETIESYEFDTRQQHHPQSQRLA